MTRHIKYNKEQNPNKIKQSKSIRRKIITAKNKGNLTSLILGQMFLLLIIIYALFNFRLSLLNTMFNYIDDSLTTSLLGGALVNIEEYGKSHQLTIYSNDAYTSAPTNSYSGWTKAEADILLSELTMGSDVLLKYEDLEHKKVLNIERRKGNTIAGGTEWNKDEYLRRSLSAFTQNLKYNTTNGKTGETEKLNILQDSSDTTIQLQNSNNMYISSDLLKNTFLGNYIISQNNGKDIEITRFDIYNLYKANLAEKHVYQSDFFTVTGKKNADGTDEVIWKTINSHTINTEENFKAVFEPTGPATSDAMIAYSQKYKKWKRDKGVVDSRQPLICYIDTGVTYQGKYDSSKVKFDYFYSSSGNRFAQTDEPLTNADKVVAGQEAPISGYSIYSYKSSNSEYNYSGGTTYSYKDETATISGTGAKSSIQISGGKMSGASIKNTSLYAEITFEMDIFPNGWINKWGDLDTKKVTVSRLIDIELKQ